jgi:hypothetical protein
MDLLVVKILKIALSAKMLDHYHGIAALIAHARDVVICPKLMKLDINVLTVIEILGVLQMDAQDIAYVYMVNLHIDV